MKKKWLISSILCTLCFLCCNLNVKALNVFGLGDGSVSVGSGQYCNDEGGCVHNETGVRVTLVDKNGKQISGTNFIDYWTSVPQGASQLAGSTYRSKYINSYGKISSNTVPYASKTSTSTSDIGGISWINQHQLIENIISKVDPKPDKCVNPQLFEKMGYDICKELQSQKCESLLEKYILIEPLFHINYRKNDLVVTGTEFTYIVDKDRNSGQKDRVYNLSGAAGYGNAFAGMYLTALNSDDDLRYAFKANGKRYVRLTETQARRYSDYLEWTHKGAYGATQEHYPSGNSMHLVWLGNKAEDCPKKCCIPCSADPTNPDCDPEDCCWASEILEGDTCKSFDEYWNNGERNWREVCLNETPNPDIPPDNPEGGCYYSLSSPDFKIDICMDGNDEPEAIFQDSLYAIDSNEVRKPTNKEIAHINGNSIVDKFMSMHYLKDSFTTGGNNIPTNMMYIDEESYKYCSKYCQEEVIIKLPDNYPYVQAGRYFYWDIKNTNNKDIHNIIYTEAERICAHDIKLDTWMAEYEAAAKVCDDAGETLASCFNMGENRFGIGGSVDCVEEAKRRLEACIGAATAEGSGTEVEGYDYEGAVASNMNTPASNTAATNAYNNSINSSPNNSVLIWYINFGTAVGVTPPPDIQAELDQAQAAANAARLEAAQNAAAQPLRNLCIEERRMVGVMTNASATYQSCIAPENKFTALIKELRSCFSELYDINGASILPMLSCEDCGLSYMSQLDIEYGYGTSLSQNEYLHDHNLSSEINDIKTRVPDVFVAKDLIEEPSCITVNGTFNEVGDLIDNYESCNYDNIFVTNDKICNPKYYFKYFGDRMHFTENYITVPHCKRTVGNPSGKSCDWSTSEIEDARLYWQTMFVTVERYRQEYSLKNDINACVCKDGTVIDLSPDGECECELQTEYSVIADISTPNWCYYEWESTTSYVNLATTNKYGNFSVEFMNQTGWYPLYLRYGNIGYELDYQGDDVGHFSKILAYLNNDDYKCPGGKCEYSDEDDYCMFFVDNKILNDAGKNFDAICPNGECESFCPDGDCDTICPNGSCTPPVIVPDEPICADGDCIYPPNIAGMELIYRTIDLDNPFPGSDATGEDSSRPPGANWQNTDDINPVSNYIENNRGVEGNKLYTSNLKPLYEFTINPAIIKKIRAFNEANRDYASIGTMIFDDGTVKGGVSYVLRGDMKNIVETNGGYFAINLDDDYYQRFDLINNNSIIDNNGNLATCREVSG